MSDPVEFQTVRGWFSAQYITEAGLVRVYFPGTSRAVYFSEPEIRQMAAALADVIS